MRLKGTHIALALLILLAASCGRKGRVIPSGTMSSIYAEMFLADQWLQDHTASRRTADTSDFYASIFRSHGYSFKDFDRSVNHYLERPEKYSRILERSSELIGEKLDVLKKEQNRLKMLEEMEKYLKKYALPPTDFEKDSLMWAPDSLKKLIVKDSTDVKGRDSIRTDTLETPRKLLRNKFVAIER